MRNRERHRLKKRQTGRERDRQTDIEKYRQGQLGWEAYQMAKTLQSPTREKDRQRERGRQIWRQIDKLKVRGLTCQL